MKTNHEALEILKAKIGKEEIEDGDKETEEEKIEIRRKKSGFDQNSYKYNNLYLP